MGGASQGPNPSSYVTFPNSNNTQTTPMGGASTSSNNKPLGSYDLATAIQTTREEQRGGREDEEFEVSGHFVSNYVGGCGLVSMETCP